MTNPTPPSREELKVLMGSYSNFENVSNVAAKSAVTSMTIQDLRDMEELCALPRYSFVRVSDGWVVVMKDGEPINKVPIESLKPEVPTIKIFEASKDIKQMEDEK